MSVWHPSAGGVRHFTATGFVVHGDATLLHWHRRVEAWIPPGGHIEPDEDPVQAVVREVMEETGLKVRIVPAQPLPRIDSIVQLHPPRTILVENVEDEKVGKHQHIDLIYFTAPDEVHHPEVSRAGGGGGHPRAPEGWVWVSRAQLEAGQALVNGSGEAHAPPEDVITLGLQAVDEVV